MKRVEKRPRGWKLELARDIKNGEQLSKGRPWPKFYCSQLTVDGKKAGPAQKERGRIGILFSPRAMAWPCARSRQNSSDCSLEQQPGEAQHRSDEVQALREP